MKKKEVVIENVVDKNALLISEVKTKYIKEYSVDSTFFNRIFDRIINEFSNVYCPFYKVEDVKSNEFLLNKIGLLIGLNYDFDRKRTTLNLTNEYFVFFLNRIIAQLVYTSFNNLINNSLSKVLNNPATSAILTLTSIISKRVAFDFSDKDDFKPISILLTEAMKSLESAIILIDYKNYNQAMTVYRLYLEQVIIAISLVKNPNLFDKYLYHLRLSSIYANNTSDKEVLKLIEEKKIPARDIKSYLNYGWIEYIPGFDEIGKRRFSIKMMATLCEISDIYELYCETTDYVHMNFLGNEIDWVRNINRYYNGAFSTLDTIAKNMKDQTNYTFVEHNVDLLKEFEDVAYEFIKITIITNFGYNFIE